MIKRREDILQRIVKLQALMAGASTEEERDVCQRRIKEMRKRYHVSDPEMKEFIGAEDPNGHVHLFVHSLKGKWRIELAGVCAWFFDCIMPYQQWTEKGIIIGKLSDATRALDLFRYLDSEVAKRSPYTRDRFWQPFWPGSDLSETDYWGTAVIHLAKRLRGLKLNSVRARRRNAWNSSQETSQADVQPSEMAVVIYTRSSTERVQDQWRQKAQDQEASPQDTSEGHAHAGAEKATVQLHPDGQWAAYDIVVPYVVGDDGGIVHRPRKQETSTTARFFLPATSYIRW